MAPHTGDTTLLLDTPIERTLHGWVERFSAEPWRGCHVEGWVFEGPQARREAQQRLAQAGVHAQFHSAYKPLIQHFLNCPQAERPSALTVRYPTPTTGPAQRFRLEAYPLAAMLPATALQWQAREDAEPWYELLLQKHDGSHATQRVHVPNRLHADTTGANVLSPTGWLRVGRSAGSADLIDMPVLTDYEQAYALAMQTVRTHPWPQAEPYFERLRLRIALPGFEQSIPWAGETFSTAEALHEDLYFSLLEFFQQRSGRPLGDRRLQPGQLLPDIRLGAEQTRVTITLEPYPRVAPQADTVPSLALSAPQLAALGESPAPEAIESTLHGWPAQRFSAASRQGRTVWGQYHAGTDHPVLLSAGQHANETSGIVGALRAAQELLQRPEANLALIALENPDGYALHRELCAVHPEHMHHAARYTALGDDVEYRDSPPLWERAVRQEALARSGAQLHVNLHGYPAHEWTRPLSGYVPRGFADWMLPKGFFLILRYHAGWQQPARTLLEAVCAALQQVPGLQAFNALQRERFAAHAGGHPFEVIDGIACMQSETAHDAPVTLITEFPDETVHGDAFRFAHSVQMHTALAAVRAWQHIAPTR